ncbi:phage holin family protein [Selenomonas bovis]|uniref:phage holin family protein n=1 Tax=Selenomonas bovis TaxID=416586 RepID=UPI003D040575
MDYSLDIRAWSAGLGAIAGGFVGGHDPLLLALVIFVSVDYITGVLCGIVERKLSSETGFRGICQKVFIFLLVGVANALDTHIIGSGSVLRSAVICFYISNEGISIIENAARIGLPVPEHLRALLEQLKKK